MVAPNNSVAAAKLLLPSSKSSGQIKQHQQAKKTNNSTTAKSPPPTINGTRNKSNTGQLELTEFVYSSEAVPRNSGFYEIDVIHEEQTSMSLINQHQPTSLNPPNNTTDLIDSLTHMQINQPSSGDFQSNHCNLIQPSSSSSTSSLSNANTTTHTNTMNQNSISSHHHHHNHHTHHQLLLQNNANSNSNKHSNSLIKLSSVHSTTASNTSNTASTANSLNNNELSNTSQTSSPLQPNNSSELETSSSGKNSKKLAGSPTTAKSSNPIAGFLQSLSNLANNAGVGSGGGGGVKMRTNKKSSSKSSSGQASSNNDLILKRISLPANYPNNNNNNNNNIINSNANYMDYNYSQSERMKEVALVEGEDDDDYNDEELNHFTSAANNVGNSSSQNKKASLYQSQKKGGNFRSFNSNYHLSAYANNSSGSANSNANGYANGSRLINGSLGHAHHIQSYQSLSSMTQHRNNMDASSKQALLLMKPLNRNSRRASMSELGYGKIESYNKLDKLGEVRKKITIRFELKS